MTNLKSSNSAGAVRGKADELRSPLSPTITREFGQINPVTTEEPILTPAQTATRILQLTSAARQLVKLGLSEAAFESLLKAYLMDPIHPQVLACEKIVLPAWELTRKHSRVNDGSSTPDDDRLRVLKARKEAERQEREKTVWEKASGKPKLLSAPFPATAPQDKIV
jgi:hypothetical protein